MKQNSLSRSASFLALFLLGFSTSCESKISPQKTPETTPGKPLLSTIVPCEEGLFLCRGTCLPVGSCSVREVAFLDSKKIFISEFDENDKQQKRGLGGFSVLDFDRDGNMDMIFATGSGSNQNNVGYRVSVIRGLGNLDFDATHPIDLLIDPPGGNLGFTHLFVSDLNGDSYSDIVVRQQIFPAPNTNDQLRSVVHVIFTGPGQSTKKIQIASDYTESVDRIFAPADIDGNGALDIPIITSGQKNLRVILLSKEDNILGLTSPIGYDPLSDGDIVLADTDGDNKAEVLVPHREGPVTKYSWSGSWFKETAKIKSEDQNITSLDVPGFFVRDVNLDGLNDILADFSFVNLGNGFFQKMGKFETSNTPQFIDMDGDGNLDIWARSSFGRGNGFGLFETPFGIDIASGGQPVGLAVKRHRKLTPKRHRI